MSISHYNEDAIEYDAHEINDDVYKLILDLEKLRLFCQYNGK